MKRLILLGSGETSPSMVTFHQNTLKQHKTPAFLDTSFGFQANADDLASKIIEYFKESVGVDIESIQLRSSEASALEIATAKNKIQTSDYIFAGPGSPTYALDVWQQMNFQDEFNNLINRGTLVLASAAALTAGAFTIPVYEIYKVGQQPSWREGLNIFAAITGLDVAVVPHFNNAEGGRHDTRFCYIGEKRLIALEQQLPDNAFILGIDEHTGIELNVDDQTITVFGKGGLTVRANGTESFYPADSVLTVDQLPKSTSSRPKPPTKTSSTVTAAELLTQGDINGAVAAAVEDLDIDRLHGFIVQLASAIDHTKLPDDAIDLLVQLRAQARQDKRWADSDLIRDFLTKHGVEVIDVAV